MKVIETGLCIGGRNDGRVLKARECGPHYVTALIIDPLRHDPAASLELDPSVPQIIRTETYKRYGFAGRKTALYYYCHDSMDEDDALAELFKKYPRKP